MSYTDGALVGKKVLVTGATGFIGGRLAERLAQEEGALVTGTGRDLSKVSFLAEAGVRLVAADLQQRETMASLMADQEIVFHVAAWLGRKGDATVAEAINVQMTTDLVRAAAAAGVRLFVHVSSIAAYGARDRGVVAEDYPVDTEQTFDYGRTKALGELAVRKLAKDLGMSWVVVRPAEVYGPRAMEWSVSMLELVKKRVPVVIGGGEGQVHPIYIDNVVDGLLLVGSREAAEGEIFNMTGPACTWKRFFQYYGRMSGRRLWGIPLWLGKVLAMANETIGLGLPLTRQTILFYEAHVDYPMDKAKRLLGYEPRVSLDEGMARTEAWLRAEGYLG